MTVFDPQQRSLAYLRYQAIDLTGLFDRVMFTASFQRQRENDADRRLSSDNLDVGETDNQSFGTALLFSSDADWLGQFTYGVDYVLRQRVFIARSIQRPRRGTSSRRERPKYPDGSAYSQVGTFYDWSADLTSRLSAVAGVRYTYVTASSEPTIDVDHDGNPGTPDVALPVFINPNFDGWTASAGLNYAVNDCVRLVGSVSEGFRAPNLDDLAATNDNVQQSAADTPSVNLLPERSISYDVGVKVDSNRIRGQLFYFWMDIDDMILRSPEPPGGGDVLFSRSNRDAHINGLEMAGEYLWPDGWSLYGNFSYYYGVDKVRVEPLSRIPPMQGIVGLRFRNECGGFADLYGWAGRQSGSAELSRT